MKLLSILFMVCLSISVATAQILAEYRWEKRLLVVSEGQEQGELESQMNEFKQHKSSLEERRLLVILSTDEGYYLGPHYDEIVNRPLSLDGKDGEQRTLEIVLVGLDGEEKQRYSGFTPVEEIFSIIDKMPMRRAEIRNGGG